ncbi:MAG: hypothetical protein JRH20_31455, partial [Deltaproteobacteria bacterium]|nr:hypothetical protein [Deltaproteobacteria bacterium]
MLLTALLLTAIACSGEVDGANEDPSNRTISAFTGIHSGFVPPTLKQGAGGAEKPMTSVENDARYAVMQSIGIGYRQYNLWWSSFEKSGLTSSATPINCPVGYELIPKDETERRAKGYHRYRCVSRGQLSYFDRMLSRDAAAGFQSGVVLWSSPPVYRHPDCEGFAWANGNMKEGCVPRDDAMDDFEDYVNIVADRYDGGDKGKVQHLIIWNENASDGWFDYSPIAPKGDTSAANVKRRIDKYAQMMRRAHTAISRHLSGVMMYASTDMLWDANIHHGHMGSGALLEGLWQRLGTDISWGVAAHPYGDPTQPAPKGQVTFYNLEEMVHFQQQQLRARGITNTERLPWTTLIASEQGWTRVVGIQTQARNICAAHAKVMSMPNVVAVSHNHFHSARADNDSSSTYGLLPYAVHSDLSNMLDYPTGKAYAATGASFGKDAKNYCCTEFGYGCPAPVVVDPDAGKVI